MRSCALLSMLLVGCRGSAPTELVTPIEGSMVADYMIGSAARVTAVTIRSCDFARAEICECMREVIGKWRFRPNVQLVQVSIRIDAR